MGHGRLLHFPGCYHEDYGNRHIALQVFWEERFCGVFLGIFNLTSSDSFSHQIGSRPHSTNTSRRILLRGAQILEDIGLDHRMSSSLRESQVRCRPSQDWQHLRFHWPALRQHCLDWCADFTGFQYGSRLPMIAATYCFERMTSPP